MDVRLLIDEPARGSWNMALDEALLESAGADKTISLRLYRWSEPTLSLGYFQRIEDRAKHAPSGPCTIVRRASGGGAIMHHHELTYSFSAPISDRVASDVERLYDAFHESLVDELRAWGVAAKKCGKPPRLSPDLEPFLCFLRRSSGDVLLGDTKICGSAQRRHQGAVLQHGSLLLKTSPYAPEVPGIEETSGVNLNLASFLQLWLLRLRDRLDMNIRIGEILTSERDRARVIELDKFGNSAWIAKR